MLKSHPIAYIIVAFTLCWTLLSCEHTTNMSDYESHQEIPDISIHINVSKNKVGSIYEFIDYITLTPLEKTSENLIAKSHQVHLHNEKFYILDREQHIVLVFSNSGKFLYKIDKMGRGPGEYAQITSIQIDPFTGFLQILSPEGKLLKYDQEGKFYKAHKLNSPDVRAVHHFVNVAKDTVVLYANYETDNLIWFDLNKDTVYKTHKTIPEDMYRNMFATAETPFQVNGNMVHYFEMHLPIVYQLTAKDANPLFRWDFGDNQLHWEELDGKDLKEVSSYLIKSNKDKVFGFTHHLRYNNKLFTRFNVNREVYELIYDFQHDTYEIYQQPYQEGVSMISQNQITFQEGLLSVIDPIYLTYFIQPDMLDKENRKVLESAQANDQSVIVKYYLE